MPLATFLSGISSLAGSGMAMMKLIRDDKQSRYPPEYLMYKDMMKMARKGYPMGMMIPGMMYPMNPYQTQVMLPQMQMTQQPIMIQPQPIIQPQPQQQVVYQVPQLNTINQSQLIQSIVQNVVNKIIQQQQVNQMTYQPRREPFMYATPPLMPVAQSPPQVIFPPNMQLPTVTFDSGPMWDTSADGVAQQPPPLWLSPIPQPLALPPPPQPQPVTQPKPTTAIMQPIEPVRYVQVPNPPPRMEPNMSVQWCDTSMELSWGTPEENKEGLKSFIEHIENSPKSGPPPGYYGNVW